MKKVIIGLLLTVVLILPFGATAVADPSVEDECLVLGGQVPPWITINPSDLSRTLYQGELVEMSLNLGKPGDGSLATCQYEMQLKSDHSIKWKCIGLSNSERSRIQGGE